MDHSVSIVCSVDPSICLKSLQYRTDNKICLTHPPYVLHFPYLEKRLPCAFYNQSSFLNSSTHLLIGLLAWKQRQVKVYYYKNNNISTTAIGKFTICALLYRSLILKIIFKTNHFSTTARGKFTMFAPLYQSLIVNKSLHARLNCLTIMSQLCLKFTLVHTFHTSVAPARFEFQNESPTNKWFLTAIGTLSFRVCFINKTHWFHLLIFIFITCKIIVYDWCPNNAYGFKMLE